MAETKEQIRQLPEPDLAEEVSSQHSETVEATGALLSALTYQFGGREADLQSLDDVFLDGKSVDSLPSPGRVLESVDEVIAEDGRTIFDQHIEDPENQRAAALVFYCRFVREERLSLDETVQFLQDNVSESVNVGYVLQWQRLGLEAILRHQVARSTFARTKPVAERASDRLTNEDTVRALSNIVVNAVVGRDGLPAWKEDARCLDGDPDAFFPEKGGTARDAKRICSTCPVQEECLEYALENDEPFGVWGGLSERERKRMTGRRLAS